MRTPAELQRKLTELDAMIDGALNKGDTPEALRLGRERHQAAQALHQERARRYAKVN